MEVKGIKHETIELFGHEFEVKVNYNTITLTTLESKAVHISSCDGYASVSLSFDTPNQIEEEETYEDGWIDGWNARVTPKPTDEEAQSDDYRQAAEYWQRMYEEKITELTCEQEERGWGTEGDHARVWLTCGHDCMVPTVQDLPKFCPECGAKVVSE